MKELKTNAEVARIFSKMMTTDVDKAKAEKVNTV